MPSIVTGKEVLADEIVYESENILQLKSVNTHKGLEHIEEAVFTRYMCLNITVILPLQEVQNEKSRKERNLYNKSNFCVEGFLPWIPQQQRFHAAYF